MILVTYFQPVCYFLRILQYPVNTIYNIPNVFWSIYRLCYMAHVRKPSEVQDLNKMHMLLLKFPLCLVESFCVHVMQLLTLYSYFISGILQELEICILNNWCSEPIISSPYHLPVLDITRFTFIKNMQCCCS